jgi:hypothetical protein
MAGSLALALLLLLLARVNVLAENPWNSVSLGWSGGAATGWSSWDATTGGTFGNSWSSHHPRRVSPAEPAYAAPPAAVHDASIDPVMFKAGSIAEHRALSHSTSLCWRYVKEALVAAGGVSSYPQTTYARDAGAELVRNYGFVKLAVNSADRAPVGCVLVYGGAGAGHVELRTARGFVSDYCCHRPANLPFLGAYTRLEKRHKEIETAQIATPMATGS